ncbi:transposase [Streptomyces sp. NPDC051956]|uniref:transposase n=1 Tax=Streptomyces sp. NPDC051956 TaxID=3365677 RepID=UPI0037CCE3E3
MISNVGSWPGDARRELSDEKWEFVRPLLPESWRGWKRLDGRTVLNGIVWKFRTGTAWRDVPERYGPWATLTHTVSLVGPGRHLRADARGRPGPGACGWGDRLAGVGRLHRRAGPPACRRSPKRGGSSPGLGRSRGGLTGPGLVGRRTGRPSWSEAELILSVSETDRTVTP